MTKIKGQDLDNFDIVVRNNVWYVAFNNKTKSYNVFDTKTLNELDSIVSAIEEDGAEVITFGCSALFWLKPFVRNGLLELGWDVPILEGYSCAIELAKSMVNLDIDASSLMFPPDHPSKWRRKKVF